MTRAAPSCRIELSARFSNGTHCRFDRIYAERWHADVPLYELLLPLPGELSFLAQFDGHGTYLVSDGQIDDVWQALDELAAVARSGRGVIDTAENRLVLERRGDLLHASLFWKLGSENAFEIPWAELRRQVDRLAEARAELQRILAGHLQSMQVDLWSEEREGLTAALAVDDRYPVVGEPVGVQLCLGNASRDRLHLVDHFQRDEPVGHDGELSVRISSLVTEAPGRVMVPPGRVHQVPFELETESAVLLRGTFSACSDARMVTSAMVVAPPQPTFDASGCWWGSVDLPAVALVPRHPGWRQQIGTDDLATWLVEGGVRDEIARRREVRAAAAAGASRVERGATAIQAGARASVARVTGWSASVEGAMRRMQDPRDPAGSAARGHVLLSLGECGAAVRAFLSAATLEPNAAHFFGLLRAHAPEGGALDEAARRCVDLLEEQPSPVSAATWTTLGRLLRELGCYQAAVDSLEAAYEAESDDPGICLELGRALKRSGDAARAREVLTWGLELQQSAELLEELARVCYFDLDDYHAAIAAYQRLFELEPDRPGGQRRYLSGALRHAGRHAEAIAVAEEGLRRNPESPAEHKTLGDALLGAERPRDALSSYDRAVELYWGGGVFTDAHYGRAECLARLGESDAAARALETILEAEPSYVIAHNKLGTIFESQGDLDRATECYRAALAIDSDSSRAAYPCCNLGTIAIKRGRFDEAIEWLTRAAELEPKLYFAHNNLGCVLLELGREQEAIRAIERAIEAEPHNPLGYFNIACVHGRAGRQREALAWLEHAIDRGYSNRKKLETEADLDSIRGTATFQHLLSRV